MGGTNLYGISFIQFMKNFLNKPYSVCLARTFSSVARNVASLALTVPSLARTVPSLARVVPSLARTVASLARAVPSLTRAVPKPSDLPLRGTRRPASLY